MKTLGSIGPLCPRQRVSLYERVALAEGIVRLFGLGLVFLTLLADIGELLRERLKPPGHGPWTLEGERFTLLCG